MRQACAAVVPDVADDDVVAVGKCCDAGSGEHGSDEVVGIGAHQAVASRDRRTGNGDAAGQRDRTRVLIGSAVVPSGAGDDVVAVRQRRNAVESDLVERN